MEALLISTGIVALAEIGDKHALAGALGAWITTWVGPQALRWVLGLSFIAMAAWILVPDKFDESEAKFARMGVFGTTLVAFFLAEMGDKTQVATVAPTCPLSCWATRSPPACPCGWCMALPRPSLRCSGWPPCWVRESASVFEATARRPETGGRFKAST